MNRRQFITRSAAASVLGFPAITRSASPNSFLQVASVGVARMGGNTMRSVSTHDKVKIVALCDVDDVHMASAVKDFPDASKHKDWRDLIAKHADSFDAITIGIPDHMHASVAISALRAKKHVYLQKPMATTIHECRAIAAESAKSNLVTQLGNQGRSSVESRMVAQMLRSGTIGKIKEVIFWENKKLNWWPKNTDLTKAADPVPGTLAWDNWIGVRDPRPYLANTYHPQTWRAIRDFGCGELGDMGCHHFDSTVDGLKLSPPKRVRQTYTGNLLPGLYADAREVEFEFEGNELIAGDTLKLTWFDGLHDPKEDSIALPKAITKWPPSGGLWIGEKGSIFKPYDQRPYLMPEDKFAIDQYPNVGGKQNHYHDWVDGILAGKPSCDPFSHGANLTEIVLCGVFAESGKGEWVNYDKATQQTNNPEINAHLTRTYRDGWKIEGLG